MSDIMIQATDLSRNFGDFRALDNVSFKVSRGEVVGFLGPNGAGKSTTMRILTCFLAPTSGDAKVHGYDVFEDALKIRQLIGYLPQRAPLYTDMNVWEYLRFVADLRELDSSRFKKALRSAVEVCGLAQVLGKDIGTLSHGYRQRVGLAQALLHDPPILILDEPTADLDPNERAEVIRYIQEIGQDRTILLSTHNLSEVEQACARAIVVSKGQIVADGALDELRARGAATYTLTLSTDGNFSGAFALEQIEKLTGTHQISVTANAKQEWVANIAASKDVDLRAELFRLAVANQWTLLGLQKQEQKLDNLFKDLTAADEALERQIDSLSSTESQSSSETQLLAEERTASDTSSELPSSIAPSLEASDDSSKEDL